MNKRSKDGDTELLPHSSKRRQFDAVDIIYPVLPIVLHYGHNLILIRRLLSMTCKDLRDGIAKLRDLTLQQEKLLAKLLDPPSIPIPYEPAWHQLTLRQIPPEARISTPPGTGKTRLMLEAAALLVLQGKVVAIYANPSFALMYEKTLDELHRIRGWKERVYLVGTRDVECFDTRLVSVFKHKILLLNANNSNGRAFDNLSLLHIEVIFTDDYVGKTFPRLVSSLSPSFLTPLRFMALTADHTTRVKNAAGDPELSVPKIRIAFRYVTLCQLCGGRLSTCAERIKEADEYKFGTLDFLKGQLKGAKRILILHNPANYLIGKYECNENFKRYFEYLVDYAELPPLIEYEVGKKIGLKIAAFNEASRATLALPWNINVLRGHNILADAVVLFNGRGAHNMALRHNFRPLNGQQLLQLLGRVRRPTNTADKLNVCMIDNFPEHLIHLLGIQDGKVPLQPVTIEKEHHINDDGMRSKISTAFDIQKVVNNYFGNRPPVKASDRELYYDIVN